MKISSKWNLFAVLCTGVLFGILGVHFFGGDATNDGSISIQMPSQPLHAVATDSNSKFAVATGYLDEDFEAIYFLDFLTGDLNAWVVSLNDGTFIAAYSRNILIDLGINPTQNPQYLMVTGVANIRQTGGSQFRKSQSIIYVSEITTGKVAAYAALYNPSMKTLRRPEVGVIQLLDIKACRRQAGGVAPGGGR